MLAFFSSIGVPEIAVILVVALIVLGPDKLPGVARQVGKALRNLQGTARDLADDLRREAGGVGDEVRRLAEQARIDPAAPAQPGRRVDSSPDRQESPAASDAPPAQPGTDGR
jgi:Tat protein translocase TatB subunit